MDKLKASFSLDFSLEKSRVKEEVSATYFTVQLTEKTLNTNSCSCISDPISLWQTQEKA